MDLNISFMASSSWDAEMPERARWLRRHDPIHWSEKDGLYVVSRFEDVVAVSKDQTLFSSGQGVRPGNPAKLSLIDEGEPRHTGLRRLINKGFTPRMVSHLETRFRAITDEAIDAVARLGECDFVESIAVPLPLLLIAEMIGIRREDMQRFHAWSDAMISAEGNLDKPEMMAKAAQAFGEYIGYVSEIIEQRRRDPKEDLVSILVHARDEGVLQEIERADAMPPGASQLATNELQMFLVLLLVAGNETTRNALSGSMELLIQHPAERQQLIDHPERIPAAVEEMLRLVSPVHSFGRTVMKPTRLRDQELAEGDTVLMLYPSANRDEAEFEDADRFVVDRNPHHVAFGIGPHFCLGANLARMELRVALTELLRRLPDMEFADAEGAVIQPSALVRSCARMRVRYTPEA